MVCVTVLSLNHAFLNERPQNAEEEILFLLFFKGKLFFHCTACQRSTKDNEAVSEQCHFSKLGENVTDETAAGRIQNVLSMAICS